MLTALQMVQGKQARAGLLLNRAVLSQPYKLKLVKLVMKSLCEW